MKLNNKNKFIHEGEPKSQIHEHDVKTHNSQFPKESHGATFPHTNGMDTKMTNRITGKVKNHHKAK